MPIQMSLGNYRAFISEFRAATGIGTARNLEQVDVTFEKVRGFRYRTSDLYMTDLWEGSGNWKPLRELNYTGMGIPENVPLSRGSISNACQYATADNGRSCGMVILVTSEAARSQVVYQVVQQALHGNSNATRAMISPFFNIWDRYTTRHHKRRPVTFGPLKAADYYEDPDAKIAFERLKEAGFIIT